MNILSFEIDISCFCLPTALRKRERLGFIDHLVLSLMGIFDSFIQEINTASPKYSSSAV